MKNLPEFLCTPPQYSSCSKSKQALYRNIRFALNEMFQKFFSCNFAFLAIMNAPPLDIVQGIYLGKKLHKMKNEKKDTYMCKF